MRYWSLIALLAVLAILISPPAQAHVPLEPGDNENLESATPIDNPTKSYVIYAELHESGEAQYYALAMGQREEIRLSMMVSRAGTSVPGIVVMGPGIESSGSVPPFVEVPAGYGAAVVNGAPPERAEYEPFTPSAIYEVASYSREITVPGIHYAAVYTPSGGGEYSLAVGYREEFTATEWLTIPIDQIRIHLWEGQPLWLVLSPLILVLLAGVGLLLRRQQRGAAPTPFVWLAGLAGLLFIGTGCMTLLQMGIALAQTGLASSALLTVVFAVVPILLGIAALYRAFRVSRPSITMDRVYMAIIGLLGFIFWAGLLVGPILALLASVLPARFIR